MFEFLSPAESITVISILLVIYWRVLIWCRKMSTLRLMLVWPCVFSVTYVVVKELSSHALPAVFGQMSAKEFRQFILTSLVHHFTHTARLEFLTLWCIIIVFCKCTYSPDAYGLLYLSRTWQSDFPSMNSRSTLQIDLFLNSNVKGRLWLDLKDFKHKQSTATKKIMGKNLIGNICFAFVCLFFLSLTCNCRKLWLKKCKGHVS